jgi:hypothetical protein
MTTASPAYLPTLPLSSRARAQRRYLAAIKALAQVQKLDAPAMQVNIGDKQINLAV